MAKVEGIGKGSVGKGGRRGGGGKGGGREKGRAHTHTRRGVMLPLCTLLTADFGVDPRSTRAQNSLRPYTARRLALTQCRSPGTHSRQAGERFACTSGAHGSFSSVQLPWARASHRCIMAGMSVLRVASARRSDVRRPVKSPTPEPSASGSASTAPQRMPKPRVGISWLGVGVGVGVGLGLGLKLGLGLAEGRDLLRGE